MPSVSKTNVSPVCRDRSIAHRSTRLLLIAALVAAIFAVLDIQNLWWRIETDLPNEPQPMNNPLAYLAMRARRSFAVVFVVSYLAVVEEAVGLKTLGWISVRMHEHPAYFIIALLLMSRRPMNWCKRSVRCMRVRSASHPKSRRKSPST